MKYNCSNCHTELCYSRLGARKNYVCSHHSKKPLIKETSPMTDKLPEDVEQCLRFMRGASFPWWAHVHRIPTPDPYDGSYTEIIMFPEEVLRTHIASQQSEIDELKRDIFQLHKQEKRRMRVSARQDKATRDMAVMQGALKISIYADRECNACPYKEVVQPEGEEACQPDGCEKWCIDRARAELDKPKDFTIADDPYNDKVL